MCFVQLSLQPTSEIVGIPIQISHIESFWEPDLADTAADAPPILGAGAAGGVRVVADQDQRGTQELFKGTIIRMRAG
jgi:hypothetical protein